MGTGRIRRVRWVRPAQGSRAARATTVASGAGRARTWRSTTSRRGLLRAAASAPGRAGPTGRRRRLVELRHDVAQLALQVLLDPPELAEALAHLPGDLGHLVRAEDEQRDHEDHEDLGRAERGHRVPFRRADPTDSLTPPVNRRVYDRCSSRRRSVDDGRPAARGRGDRGVARVSVCTRRPGVRWRRGTR